MATGGSTFAEATAVKALSSHTYEANFVDDWCIGSVPHGGYVTSTFLRVASLHFSSTLSSQNQPDTIAVHLSFLRRTQAGPALFTVKDTKLGRQTSVIHVTLTQEESSREEVVGYITQTNFSQQSGPSFATSWQLNPAAAPADLTALARAPSDGDENWVLQREMPFAAFRKATHKTAFYFPRGGQASRSRADEWIRLRTAPGERWTTATLGYVADMWPMPIEAFMSARNPYDVQDGQTHKDKDGETRLSSEKELQGQEKRRTMWYPTLLLNLDVKKALPPEGVEWLFVRVEAKRIVDGRMDLEVIIMDEGGDLVALSQHVAFAVDASRNVAKRRKAEDSKI